MTSVFLNVGTSIVCSFPHLLFYPVESCLLFLHRCDQVTFQSL
jgi:hypothetical protein